MCVKVYYKTDFFENHLFSLKSGTITKIFCIHIIFYYRMFH